jgi:hypothetical protein
LNLRPPGPQSTQAGMTELRVPIFIGFSSTESCSVFLSLFQNLFHKRMFVRETGTVRGVPEHRQADSSQVSVARYLGLNSGLAPCVPEARCGYRLLGFRAGARGR